MASKHLKLYEIKKKKLLTVTYFTVSEMSALGADVNNVVF